MWEIMDQFEALFDELDQARETRDFTRELILVAKESGLQTFTVEKNYKLHINRVINIKAEIKALEAA